MLILPSKNVLELVLVIAHKTISDFANHLVETPVDAPFTAFAWDSFLKSY